MRPERVRKLNEHEPIKGPHIYWMSRDQRAHDNWALIHTQQEAKKTGSPVHVVFCLVDEYPNAQPPHFAFLKEGLTELKQAFDSLDIPFHILKGDPVREIPEFIRKTKAGLLVTDFDPLRIKRKWKHDLWPKAPIAYHEVDAHNVVPCWHASDKQEFGAYTIRPKIHRMLPTFLETFPRLNKGSGKARALELEGTMHHYPLKAGEKAAHKKLRDFIKHKLPHFDRRNDPNAGVTSHLSAYLHFGHISAQRIALEVEDSDASKEVKDAFLEQLIVRRELADNFCYYNKEYDSVKGFPQWARTTHDVHAKDKREYVYSRKDLEQANTHDPLWNAAQKEMMRTGYMHGYLRMYWAKKILEWSRDPKDAMKKAIHLNDTYELDGRDPNGYVGIAWSIGGVHDRPWPERNVFGKVRYMNDKGARRKFDVDAYISYVDGLYQG